MKREGGRKGGERERMDLFPKRLRYFREELEQARAYVRCTRGVINIIEEGEKAAFSIRLLASSDASSRARS